MFFAVWTGRRSWPEAMGERIEAWDISSEATTFRRGQSLLAALAPSSLTVSGDVGIASSGALTCHPRAVCQADGELRLDAGVLPQYPLYYLQDIRPDHNASNGIWGDEEIELAISGLKDIKPEKA